MRVFYFANPFYEPRHAGASGNPHKISVYVNIRESAVGVLYARGHIDKAQWAAAGRFRKYLRRSGGKGAASIDYVRERVDGGKIAEPLSDALIDAVQQHNDCKLVLGRKAFDLMIAVVGQGMEIADIAKTQREKTTYSDYLKDGLNALAEHWGYKSL